MRAGASCSGNQSMTPLATNTTASTPCTQKNSFWPALYLPAGGTLSRWCVA